MRSQNSRFGGVSGAPRQRQLRVAENIRHVLSHVLERGEARDPGLDNVSVTVTEVRVSSDLRHVTAFVLPLGGGGAEELLDGLRRAAPFLRKRIGRTITLKRLPALKFELDSRFDRADRIDALLRDRPASTGREAEESRDAPVNAATSDGT